MPAKKPSIAVVGAGNLGSAMARALHASGYQIGEIVYRPGRSSAQARRLAREIGAVAVTSQVAKLDAAVIWICVGDSAIQSCAAQLAHGHAWRGKIAFHSSGALSSAELQALKRCGAAVASVHPMMSFVREVRPELKEVTFAIEGDERATRVARRIARDLGGRPVAIEPRRKPMYHAFGAFTSPLIVATIALAERVARKAGLKDEAARAAIAPILKQTVRNALERGPAAAFSGPLVRGDVQTIRRHLQVLEELPEARAAYIALAKAALKTLPVRNKKVISQLLK